MTSYEFESKCAILAQTPQSRWFELRLKAFVNMMNNANVNVLDINYLFPIAPMINFVGYFFVLNNKYYFFLANKQGSTFECFNVETIDLSGNLTHVLSSHIVLSSDDDAGRSTFLPLLMSASQLDRISLKAKVDDLFRRAVRGGGARQI